MLVANIVGRRKEMVLPEFVAVAKASEVADQSGTCVEVGGKRIALFNRGGQFYAIDDDCTHQGGPLSEGMVEGTVVTCPWHGATYDISTGNVLGPPAPTGVARYNVRVTGEAIEIEV